MRLSRTTIVIVLVVFLYAAVQFSEWFRIAYEEASLWVSPDAAKAMSYGDRHFSSRIPQAYNIDIAEHFYDFAEKVNSSTPFVYHQLARIAFLHNKNGTAMILIDKQIAMTGDSFPNAYYVRGLIEGFDHDYSHSEADYRKYLAHDPTNWAATNDLAWVLLRDNKPREALDAIDAVLPRWKQNPWLLNSRATALHELGRDVEAREAIETASKEVANVTASQWLLAYPGNDPQIADRGLEALKSAIAANLSSLSSADKSHR